jgi:hypothetical protein
MRADDVFSHRVPHIEQQRVAKNDHDSKVSTVVTGEKGMSVEQPGGTPEPGSERRGAPRQQTDLRVTCYPAVGGSAAGRPARVRNLSRTGIGLVVDQHWPPGMGLTLALPLLEGGGTRPIMAKVIHATAQPGGRFLVGCAFDTPLTDNEVQTLTGGVK